MLFRILITLVLSIVGITSSACAESSPLWTVREYRAEYEATAKELRKLAEEGNVTAQNRLGLLYKEGKGVPQNYGQAKRWFEEAAKQGHAEAQVNLGTFYLHGDAPPQSARMALFWLVGRQSKELLRLLRNLGRCMKRRKEYPRILSRPTCGLTWRQQMERRTAPKGVMFSP